MTFTEEEEIILKFMAEECKARWKLNIENKKMGDAIRAEFKTIDERIREEHKVKILGLQGDFNNAQQAIKERFE